jgi:K+-sensing histidine kinase KdpD
MTPSDWQFWLLHFAITIAAGLVVVAIARWLQERADARWRKEQAEQDSLLATVNKELPALMAEAERLNTVKERLANVLDKRPRLVGKERGGA